MGGALAAGVRGLAAGADRQRRARAAAARRLWRGDGRAAPGPARRAGAGRGRLGAAARAAGPSRDRLARARRGHLGGARRPRATSPTPRSWPGWRSTGRCKSVETFGLDGPVERWRRLRRRDPRATSAANGFDRRARQLRPVLRLAAARREPAAAADHRASCRRRTRGSSGRWRRSSGACSCDGLVARYDTAPRSTTGCRQARVPSSPAASGWPTPTSCSAAGRGAAAVRAPAGAAQRCRPAGRVDTRSGPAAGRQLPASLLASGAGSTRRSIGPAAPARPPARCRAAIGHS